VHTYYCITFCILLIHGFRSQYSHPPHICLFLSDLFKPLYRLCHYLLCHSANELILPSRIVTPSHLKVILCYDRSYTPTKSFTNDPMYNFLSKTVRPVINPISSPLGSWRILTSPLRVRIFATPP